MATKMDATSDRYVELGIVLSLSLDIQRDFTLGLYFYLRIGSQFHHCSTIVKCSFCMYSREPACSPHVRGNGNIVHYFYSDKGTALFIAGDQQQNGSK